MNKLSEFGSKIRFSDVLQRATFARLHLQN
jgi:hypothetical protein